MSWLAGPGAEAEVRNQGTVGRACGGGGLTGRLPGDNPIPRNAQGGDGAAPDSRASDSGSVPVAPGAAALSQACMRG